MKKISLIFLLIIMGLNFVQSQDNQYYYVKEIPQDEKLEQKVLVSNIIKTNSYLSFREIAQSFVEHRNKFYSKEKMKVNSDGAVMGPFETEQEAKKNRNDFIEEFRKRNWQIVKINGFSID